MSEVVGWVLTRERILEVGLELVDQDGPDKLSMRRLGQRLGVTATAIYHYFHGREELLEAIVDQLCARVVSDAPEHGQWADQLRALLSALVRHASRYPSATAWAITAYSRRGPTLRIHEAILAVLDRAGFSPYNAVYVKGAVMRFCIGHLTLNEAAPGHEWRSLAEHDFPYYRAAGPALDKSDPAEQFRLGLDILLAGIAASALAPKTSER